MGRIQMQARWRPSYYFLLVLLALLALFSLCYAHFVYEAKQAKERESIIEATVAVVGSPDLAINNAARFIRHVSLTDVSTAFQDCPACPDYFPGTLSANPPDYVGLLTRVEEAPQ